MNDLWTQAVMVMGLVVLAYYFVTLAVNLAVLWASLGLLGRKMRVASAHLDLPEERAEAVSVLVPVFNEEVTILDTVRALLRQDYPRYEVIVVNDGSADGTLDLLRQEFGLRPLDPAGEGPLPCGQVRGLFISESRRDLIVVDKENGGKADALNAGLNAARYPLVCCVDADGLLEPDALKKLACQFARDDRVVAAGGVVRPLNGCLVQNGAVTKAGVPPPSPAGCRRWSICGPFCPAGSAGKRAAACSSFPGPSGCSAGMCCWRRAATPTAWARTWS